MKTNIYHYYRDSSIKYIQKKHATTTKKTSFKSFHANFLKTNVYHYCRDSSMKYINKFMQLPPKKLVSTLFILISWKPIFITTIETHTINSWNYHKKTSFKCFHANFLKTNIYHYYWDSSIEHILYIHATTTKKLVSSHFMLISWKPMFIITTETRLSNISLNSCNYQKKTTFNSFHANILKTNVYHYYRESYNKFMQLPQKN